MTSTNDGKDVKSNQISGQKGKTYYIELYKSLDARLSAECAGEERTRLVCEAWRRVHSLCLQSAPSTHVHLLSWLQRHAAHTILQTEWQSPKSKEQHTWLEDAIKEFISECQEAVSKRNGVTHSWESQLLQRAHWFRSVLPNPWEHHVLKALLDSRGPQPSDKEVLEWLKEERSVMFVTRLRQLAASKCDDLALLLAAAVMERARRCTGVVTDVDQAAEPKDKPEVFSTEPTFQNILRKEAGFTPDVWEVLTDIEFVLLYKGESRARCIELAKQTPLRLGYQLVERLHNRLENFPQEKKLWKNAKDVATLIAQVVIARCMVVPQCAGVARAALYGCVYSLVQLLPAEKLPTAAAALAAPAATSRHLHTLAAAVHAQCKEDRKPFVCTLYVRAITAGMNELENLKLNTEKASEARSTEQILASWFIQLGNLLTASSRLSCECILTAFSVHPSQTMYDIVKRAPPLAPLHKPDIQEQEPETNSEFGSWATDSRTQTNFVKTSETLKLKQTQKQANVLSTAIFAEGEALGLEADLCQDLAVLLSGPRVKTLYWDLDKDVLLENCRTYMERTHSGTRALTTELKYLNLDPTSFQHLPEEEDDENDIYYGIEKGYEHLVEIEEPEEFYEHMLSDYSASTDTATSLIEFPIAIPKQKKKKCKPLHLSPEEEVDPLSLGTDILNEEKERPHSKERSKHKNRERSKSKVKVDCSKELDASNGLSEEKSREIQRKAKKKDRKERKKKEKLEMKLKEQNFQSCSRNLSRLVGMKITRPNISETERTPLDSKGSMCGTDSDYDSQGKSSINSEINENVLFDGLYSMEDTKSPQKMLDYKHRTDSRPFVYTPQNVSAVKEEVTKGIKKLIEYRRNKALIVKSKDESSDNQRNNLDHNLSLSKSLPSSLLSPKIHSKEVTVPHSHNVIYNKQGIKQFMDANNESSSSFIDSNNAENVTIERRNLNLSFEKITKGQELSAFDSTLQKRQPIIMKPKQTSQNQKQYLEFLLQRKCSAIQDPTKPASDSPSQIQFQEFLKKQSTSQTVKVPATSLNDTRKIQHISKQTSQHSINTKITPIQNEYHNFFKELQETINAGANNDMQGSKSFLMSDMALPKKVIPPKKPDNVPNTFARLSYMHKNKQFDNKPKSVNNQIVQKTSQSITTDHVQHLKNINLEKVSQLQSKGEIVISRVDKPKNKCANENAKVLVQNIENLGGSSTSTNTPLHYNKQYPVMSNMLLSDKRKTDCTLPTKNEVKVIKQCSNVNSKNSTSFLSEKDQFDILLLLRQQSKMNPPKITAKTEFPKKTTPDGITILNNTVVHSVNMNKKCLGSQNNVPILEGSMSKPYPISVIKGTQNKPLNNGSEIKKNRGTPKQRVKNEDAQQSDWKSVMDDILAHKTPSRGPNALDIALKKDSFEKRSSESLGNQSHRTVITSCKNPNIVGNANNIVVQSTANLSTKVSTSTVNPLNSKAPVMSSILKQKEGVVLSNAKSGCVEILKKNPIHMHKKHFPSVIQNSNDPFISGIPNSDYDLLEELMDDDLRQEIGELSSDEEAYRTSDLSTSKTKNNFHAKESNPLINKAYSAVTGNNFNVDLITNSNSVKESYNTNYSTILNKDVFQKGNCLPKHKKYTLTNDSSQPRIIYNEMANQTVPVKKLSPSGKVCKNVSGIIQEAITSNNNLYEERASHNKNTFVITTPKTNIPISNKISNNKSNLQKTVDNFKGHSNNDNIHKVNKSQNVLDPAQVVLRKTAQNVMLIGTDVIYDPFSTIQMNQPATSGNISNPNKSNYVTVNQAPMNLTLLRSTPFTGPVLSPVIIESSITLPVIQTVSPNVSKNLSSNSDKPDLTTICTGYKHVNKLKTESNQPTNVVLEKLCQPNKNDVNVNNVCLDPVGFNISTSTVSNNRTTSSLIQSNSEENDIATDISDLSHYNKNSCVEQNRSETSKNSDLHRHSRIVSGSMQLNSKEDGNLTGIPDSLLYKNQSLISGSIQLSSKEEDTVTDTTDLSQCNKNSISCSIHPSSKKDDVITDIFASTQYNNSSISGSIQRNSEEDPVIDISHLSQHNKNSISSSLQWISKKDIVTNISDSSQYSKSSIPNSIQSNSKKEDTVTDISDSSPKNKKSISDSIQRKPKNDDIVTDILDSSQCNTHLRIEQSRSEADKNPDLHDNSKRKEALQVQEQRFPDNEINSIDKMSFVDSKIDILAEKERIQNKRLLLLNRNINNRCYEKPIALPYASIDISKKCNKKPEIHIKKASVEKNKSDSRAKRNISKTTNLFQIQNKLSDDKLVNKKPLLRLKKGNNSKTCHISERPIATHVPAIIEPKTTNKKSLLKSKEIFEEIQYFIEDKNIPNLYLSNLSNKDKKISDNESNIKSESKYNKQDFHDTKIKDIEKVNGSELYLHQGKEIPLISGHSEKSERHVLSESELIDIDEEEIKCQHLLLDDNNKSATSSHPVTNDKNAEEKPICGMKEISKESNKCSSQQLKELQNMNSFQIPPEKQKEACSTIVKKAKISKAKINTEKKLVVENSNCIDIEEQIKPIIAKSTIKKSNKPCKKDNMISDVGENDMSHKLIARSMNTTNYDLSNELIRKKRPSIASDLTTNKVQEAIESIASEKHREEIINSNTMDAVDNTQLEKSGNNREQSKINENLCHKNNSQNLQNGPCMLKNTNSEDKILIHEIPNAGNGPLKRCVRIKLPNGNSFKATISGTSNVNINSIFEDPTVKSLLWKKINNNVKCTLNIKQVSIQNNKDQSILKTEVKDICYPQLNSNDTETINLISDDEDDSQSFKTEFGNFIIPSMDPKLYRKHQEKFSQKTVVALERCNVLQDFFPKDSAEEKSIPEEVLVSAPQEIITDYIEIDDSSNDSVDIKESLLKNTNTNYKSHLSCENVEDLKSLLLKDLGVEDSNNLIENLNITNDINRSIEEPPVQSKEVLLKIKKCDDLVEKMRIQNQKCFVSLVRCDDTLQSFKRKDALRPENKTTDEIPDEMLCLLDDAIVTETTLQRSNSVSILNELLLDNTVDISSHNEKICTPTSPSLIDNFEIPLHLHENLNDTNGRDELLKQKCDTDWLMTKSLFNKYNKIICHLPQILTKKLKECEKYKDCINDGDSDICLSMHENFNIENKCGTKNYKVPSLLKLIVNFFACSSGTLDRLIKNKLTIKNAMNSSALKRKSTETLEKWRQNKYSKIENFNNFSSVYHTKENNHTIDVDTIDSFKDIKDVLNIKCNLPCDLKTVQNEDVPMQQNVCGLLEVPKNGLEVASEIIENVICDEKLDMIKPIKETSSTIFPKPDLEESKANQKAEGVWEVNDSESRKNKNDDDGDLDVNVVPVTLVSKTGLLRHFESKHRSLLESESIIALNGLEDSTNLDENVNDKICANLLRNSIAWKTNLKTDSQCKKSSVEHLEVNPPLKLSKNSRIYMEFEENGCKCNLDKSQILSEDTSSPEIKLNCLLNETEDPVVDAKINENIGRGEDDLKLDEIAEKKSETTAVIEPKLNKKYIPHDNSKENQKRNCSESSTTFTEDIQIHKIQSNTQPDLHNQNVIIEENETNCIIGVKSTENIQVLKKDSVGITTFGAENSMPAECDLLTKVQNEHTCIKNHVLSHRLKDSILRDGKDDAKNNVLTCKIITETEDTECLSQQRNIHSLKVSGDKLAVVAKVKENECLILKDINNSDVEDLLLGESHLHSNLKGIDSIIDDNVTVTQSNTIDIKHDEILNAIETKEKETEAKNEKYPEPSTISLSNFEDTSEVNDNHFSENKNDIKFNLTPTEPLLLQNMTISKNYFAGDTDMTQIGKHIITPDSNNTECCTILSKDMKLAQTGSVLGDDFHTTSRRTDDGTHKKEDRALTTINKDKTVYKDKIVCNQLLQPKFLPLFSENSKASVNSYKEISTVKISDNKKVVEAEVEEIKSPALYIVNNASQVKCDIEMGTLKFPNEKVPYIPDDINVSKSCILSTITKNLETINVNLVNCDGEKQLLKKEKRALVIGDREIKEQKVYTSNDKNSSEMLITKENQNLNLQAKLGCKNETLSTYHHVSGSEDKKHIDSEVKEHEILVTGKINIKPTTPKQPIISKFNLGSETDALITEVPENIDIKICNKGDADIYLESCTILQDRKLLQSKSHLQPNMFSHNLNEQVTECPLSIDGYIKEVNVADVAVDGNNLETLKTSEMATIISQNRTVNIDNKHYDNTPLTLKGPNDIVISDSDIVQHRTCILNDEKLSEKNINLEPTFKLTENNFGLDAKINEKSEKIRDETFAIKENDTCVPYDKNIIKTKLTENNLVVHSKINENNKKSFDFVMDTLKQDISVSLTDEYNKVACDTLQEGVLNIKVDKNSCENCSILSKSTQISKTNTEECVQTKEYDEVCILNETQDTTLDITEEKNDTYNDIIKTLPKSCTKYDLQIDLQVEHTSTFSNDVKVPDSIAINKEANETNSCVKVAELQMKSEFEDGFPNYKEDAIFEDNLRSTYKNAESPSIDTQSKINSCEKDIDSSYVAKPGLVNFKTQPCHDISQSQEKNVSDKLTSDLRFTIKNIKSEDGLVANKGDNNNQGKSACNNNTSESTERPLNSTYTDTVSVKEKGTEHILSSINMDHDINKQSECPNVNNDISSLGTSTKELMNSEKNEKVGPCMSNDNKSQNNVTLVYNGDSSVILKGSIYEDPVLGTCYVFPVINRASLSEETEEEGNICDYDTINVLEDSYSIERFNVAIPKLTYSRQRFKRNDIIKIDDQTCRKNLKRKLICYDSKFYAKRYRKSKNIDYPKFSVATILESAYSKEYKRLLDYYSSVKFSYSRPFHKEYIDVINILKSWPIKETELKATDNTDIEHILFSEDDVENKVPFDPLQQTLAEELSQCSERHYVSEHINENNFNMGFGEGSDRVIQISENINNISKVSAATLSDVKHSQPFLTSEDSTGYKRNQTQYTSNKHQIEVIKRSISYIQLRDKVRSFFKKTTAELNYDWLMDTRKTKYKKPFNSLHIKNGFPYDLINSDFIEPAPFEAVVQVVQVGQLPVSAAAQNPVTCDPRVTQVTDASPQCSIENSPHDDSQSPIKTEYTELTTADLSLPLVQEYERHMESQESSKVPNNHHEDIPVETEVTSIVKTEITVELSPLKEEPIDYSENDDLQSLVNKHINNVEYSFDSNDNSILETQPATDITYESLENHETDFTSQQKQQNGSAEKTDQIAHAMNAAGITTTPETMINTRAHALVNMLSQKICQEGPTSTSQSGNSYTKTPINAMTLQQALAQILPPPLNQSNSVHENNQTTTNSSVTSQVLHIVQGKNTNGNQITLVDNTQNSAINNSNTPVLHIVQNKGTNASSTSNTNSGQHTNSYSGLSLVDTGIQQGSNQLLHIVNTGNQKNNSTGQLIKRVNLLTNLTNVQGSNEQKMVQFVCKSADGKAIHLNAPHQRSMVLRLHPIESSSIQTTPKATDSQDNVNTSPTTNTHNITPNKESTNTQQEIKSRSIYEENYAKFIQNSSNKSIEKATSLPKFNQAFGKQVFQDGNQKGNDINANNSNLSSINSNSETSECQTNDNSVNLDHIGQINSPPLLLRKSPSQTTQTQPSQVNLVQQIKQTIAPMNIQTMHGGVIYTRQIPVNIGGGQTINLITVPSTELIEDGNQKQKGDVKFVNQNELDSPIIKIVPQNQNTPNPEGAAEDSNNHAGLSNENAHNSTTQHQPVLTQMRIKLPMLSKTPQMVSGARVVRPSFFQIQRNVIGGANQHVYQQLVLTAAPPLGQHTIRLPQTQAGRQITKTTAEGQSPSESQMSSSTLEQLREFDMVLEQVKERSTVQPNSNSNSAFTKLLTPTTDTTDGTPATSTVTESTQQVLYSIGSNQSLNVAYINRKTIATTPTTSTFVRSPDSTGIIDSPSSSTHIQIPHTVTSESTINEATTQPNQPKPAKVGSKSKSRPKSSSNQPNSLKINTVPPKTSNQKPLEDEQTTQRILYILAEYKEQVENSPDKDKPAPRRRSNPPTNPSGSSKRKKSSSSSRRPGVRDMSPVHGEDTCRTMGSEDSSCGTSQGDCNESCLDSHSPQDSPRKVVRKLTFESETPTVAQPRPQPQRNVIVADGQTITVARGTAGKPATAVLMPANYILPVSMVKGGQQIAIVTNRGPKLLTVGGGEGGATNALLLQRLIGPAGLKPVLTRPGVRHVRLPTAALHNLQAFNLTAATTVQPPDSTASPAPVPTPELVETRAGSSPWRDRESQDVKPERESSPEGSEPWNLPSSADPHDYTYEETVRTDNMDRTVLEAIPDRYSPDMEAQRIFDKMFDVDSKKSYIVDSHDDSSRCAYDIDASDCDDKVYHQVVHKKDGTSQRHHRLTHVSAAALRHKYAILEHELRLQKSLSEECEDLGVDSPSASELFPEAELLFAASPAHDAPQHSHTPQPTILNQSGIPQPDIDDQIATDELLQQDAHEDRQELDVTTLGLDEGIVTVSEDGMQATIALDQEEFARSHPNTTFHSSEPTDEGEIQPFTISGLKGRHITSTIFHAGRAPATVLVTAPQTTVISQANTDNVMHNNVKYANINQIINSSSGTHGNLNLSSVLVKDDGLTKFDSILTDTRELHLSNTASAIVHSTGNATQVIRRVCYEDDKRDTRFLMDEPDALIAGDDAKMIAEDSSRDATLESIAGDVDDDNSSPERHAELFWESNSASERSESRRPMDFSSDSEKCCKSPSFDETNSTDSSGVGTHMRLDSVIKDARGMERSGSADGSSADDTHPPLRTYPAKRMYHVLDGEVERSMSGKTRAGERSPDSLEVRRRASGRGVVKRGCHCCTGSPAPPRPKKSRQRKPAMDFAN